MKILGLDISTKTGFAIIEDGKLLSYGLIKPDKVPALGYVPDLDFVLNARNIALHLGHLIKVHNPDHVYIEQTNSGRFRTSQKELEMIHCCFLEHVYDFNGSMIPNVHYVDTSRWRSVIGLRMTKEQKKHNKEVKQKTRRGKITPKHLVVEWANRTYSLGFKKKDHDIADSCAIATYGYLDVTRSKPSVDTLESILLK